MPIRHIGFDLDGTLIDTRAQIVESVVSCVDPSRELEARFLAEARCAGSPLAILRQLGVSTLRSYWTHHARYCDQAKLFFESTQATLERLRAKGISLSIVTSLPARPAANLLRATGLASFFELIDTHSSRRFRKPSPGLLLEHLDVLGVTPSEAAYLGDSVGDMQMANGAGAHTWAVGWGEVERDTLVAAGAELIVDKIDDLVEAAVSNRTAESPA
jgi:HAD superfamily hydrolase (TIGR01549 family)